MNNFKFSEDLVERVREALIDRMADAFQNDSDCAKDAIKYGIKAVDDLDGIELMDEYMNWHGTFSLEENPDDKLLAAMFREMDDNKFEEEVLSIIPHTQHNHPSEPLSYSLLPDVTQRLLSEQKKIDSSKES